MSSSHTYHVYEPGQAPSDLVTERQLEEHCLTSLRPPVAAYLALSRGEYPLYSLTTARILALHSLNSLVGRWQEVHGTTETPTIEDLRNFLEE